jgi:hypothetical protein
MLALNQHRPFRNNSWWTAAILGGALMLVLSSAYDIPGSCNDKSRFAAVECLVDQHTFAIDHSTFQTGDKVFINGHFYSHKSPVVTVLLAGVYQGLQWTTGLTAQARLERFCYWMTVASAGLAYVLAVWSVFQMGQLVELPLSRRLVLTASFAVGTLALPYMRAVNDHILLLGLASSLMLLLARLARQPHAAWSSGLLLGIGTLAGLGYTIDLGCGLILLLCTFPLVVYRCRRWQPLLLFGLGALPWLILHHALNYWIGGTLVPYAAVPAYYQYPGSLFDSSSLTGVWTNYSLGIRLRYGVALLAGPNVGFLNYNVAFLLAIPAGFLVCWRRVADRPEVVFAACWCAGTWLLYTLGSTNYAGLCLSIRWFVPLLAAGYYVLALGLHWYAKLWGDFLVFAGWSIALGWFLWWQGPWRLHTVTWCWRVVPLALLSCFLLRIKRLLTSRSRQLAVTAYVPDERSLSA